MNLQPSHLVFLVGICVYLAIRVYFQRLTAREAKSISKSNGRDLSLVVLLGAAQIGLPLELIVSPWLNWANYISPPAAIWAGSSVMLVALWLFWRSHADLGKSWSVTLELNQDHRLITGGVYRFIRHPMYASFFLLAFAQGLLLSNWLAGWAALVAVVLLYVVRVPNEEAMMLGFFGNEYRGYMQRTGGIIPRVRGGSAA